MLLLSHSSRNNSWRSPSSARPPRWRRCVSEAVELKTGDALSMADGRTAIVAKMTEDDAGPSSLPCATYNFEVADYHTYFVGELGVLVHNNAARACQQALSILTKFYEREGDIWQAYVRSLERFPTALTERIRLRVFNETRAKWFSGEFLGSTPPWLNTTVQDLGQAGDSAILGKNLKSIGIEAPWYSVDGSEVAAHHIVAHGDQRAAATRALLQQGGVDINEAANGLFLPKNQAVANAYPELGPPHNRIHTDSYYQTLEQRLSITAPANMRKELQRIADELIRGVFPW